jgi:hypothetical protein
MLDAVAGNVASPRTGIGYAAPRDRARRWRFTAEGPATRIPSRLSVEVVEGID